MELKAKTTDSNTYVVFSDNELNAMIKAEMIMHRLLNEMLDKKVHALTMTYDEDSFKLKSDDIAKICIDFGKITNYSVGSEFFD